MKLYKKYYSHPLRQKKNPSIPQGDFLPCGIFCFQPVGSGAFRPPAPCQLPSAPYIPALKGEALRRAG